MIERVTQIAVSPGASRNDRRSARFCALIVLAVAALALTACGSSSPTPKATTTVPTKGAAPSSVPTSGGAPSSAAVKSTDNVPTVSKLGPRSFTSPGPFSVGVRTLRLPDKASVEVWYPATAAAVTGTKPVSYNVADFLPAPLQKLFPPSFKGGIYQTDAHRDVSIASGRFPLVEFTHGYSGFPTQSTFLTTHLASWGFVVAAPDLLDNDLAAVIGGKSASGSAADIAEVRATITLMAQQNSAPSGPFTAHVDMSRIAAIGHSLGGAVSEGVASADPRVTTFIGMAGATVGAFGQGSSGPDSVVPGKPGMLMVGTSDKVADPAGIAKAYTAMKQPKRLVTLTNFGHLVFADICEIGPTKGGLAGLAAGAGLPLPGNLKKLATDGCEPPDAPVTSGWGVIRQAVTAQLRHVFGFDSNTAGLTGLKAAYPKVVTVETNGQSAPK